VYALGPMKGGRKCEGRKVRRRLSTSQSADAVFLRICYKTILARFQRAVWESGEPGEWIVRPGGAVEERCGEGE